MIKPETRRIAQLALAMTESDLRMLPKDKQAQLVLLRQLAKAQGLEASCVKDASEALRHMGNDRARARSSWIFAGVICLGIVVFATLSILVHVAFFEAGSGTQKDIVTEIARGKRLRRIILSLFGFAFSIFCLVLFCLVMGFGDVKQACAEFGLPVRYFAMTKNKSS